jgi:hypothetical protein
MAPILNKYNLLHAPYRAPPLSEYTHRHPELAEQIKELFPALVMMEQFKPAAADHTGSFADRLSGPNGATAVSFRCGTWRPASFSATPPPPPIRRTS